MTSIPPGLPHGYDGGMKINIIAVPGADGADARQLHPPTWVAKDIPAIREWALTKARSLFPPVELVELRSDDDSVRELWRPDGEGWVEDDA